MKRLALAAALAALPVIASASSVLFIGNSFTFADKSAVHFWHADTVDDLNHLGIGGMPALFKQFTVDAGLHYDVALETHPGVGLDWHLEHRGDMLAQRPWGTVVMHGYSTLDAHKPGDPATLVQTVHRMADLLRARNPAVDLRVMATWPRADQTYEPKGAWYGKPIDAMTHDVRAGYDKAAAATPGMKPPIPVGDAWLRAMQAGVADPNPYDGIAFGKLDLWSYDHYHASVAGYYLEALVVFGSISGVDPRSLGGTECAGFELGLSKPQVSALEQVAFDQLAAANAVKPAPLAEGAEAGEPQGCARGR